MKKALALSQLLAGLNEGPRGLPHQSILPLNFYLTFSTIKLKNKACPPQFKIQVCRQSIQHSAWSTVAICSSSSSSWAPDKLWIRCGYLRDRPPGLLYSSQSRWWACGGNGCESLWGEREDSETGGRRRVQNAGWAAASWQRSSLTSSTLLLSAPIMCSRHCSTPTPLPLLSRWVATGMT